MLNGERLREGRIAQNLTQEDMAKKLGITRQAYGNYESGKRDVDSQTLVNLVKILNVSVDYLLGLSTIKTLEHNLQTEIIEIQDWTDKEKELAKLIISNWRKINS
ncbi:helix-turn-helix domain-containing protein [Paenibacillus sp. NPDC057886]|uniref:helix-turn-helix domain-containing protein n=1 Tax=Paenibacillus sp. NPDC057886 TaxID=3346270 RepID=UPI00369938B1